MPTKNETEFAPAERQSSPLADAIGPVVEAGYRAFLRPASPPGVTVLYKSGPKISDGKVPHLFNGKDWTGWQKWPEYRPTEDDPARWSFWPDAGLALVTGEIAAFDIDIKIDDGDRSEAAGRARGLIEAIGSIIARFAGVDRANQLPLRYRARSSSCAILVKAGEAFRKKKVSFMDPATGAQFAVERLADGQQIVIAGKHISGDTVCSNLADFPFEDMPTISKDVASEIMEAIEEEVRTSSFVVITPASKSGRPRDAGEGPLRPDQKVMRAIMLRRAEWVPNVVPCQPGAQDTEWRVASADEMHSLDRDLEEDLVIYPDGIYDFGTDRPHTPLSLIREFGHLDAASDITFGGCPVYGPADDEPFMIVSDIEGVRRPNEAEVATWLCRQLGDKQMKALPANTTWSSALPSLARAVGLDWDALGKEEVARHFEKQRAAGLHDRPFISIRLGELDRVTTEAEAALVASGSPIYDRSGILVRPIAEKMPVTRGRTAYVTRTARVTKEGLIYHLTLAAAWEKFDGRRNKMVKADPPKQIAEIILSRDGEWKFPKLAGIITTPTLRPDFSILSEPGYDLATSLLLLNPPTMPAIPERPNRGNAEQGLALLQSLLRGFTFVSEADRSVALSMLMTPVVRGALMSAPLHAVRAPTPGSGKSYLTDIAAAISTGQPCPVIAPHPDEKEVEKRLGAALLGAQPLISIDNLNSALGGDALCQITERPVVQIRVLGRSELVRIENKATLFATGNNLHLAGDIVRRAVICTLDPGVERPELRQFKSNPFDDVLADRGKYVAAALTIVRAYVAAGFPGLRPDLGSFRDWSRLVRSSLVWLGCADPVDTMEAARSEDPILSSLSAVLSAWQSAIGIDVPLTAGSIKDQALAHPELHAALAAVAGDRFTVDARELGKWLGRYKGRVVSGLKLEAERDKHLKQNVWVLKSTGIKGISGCPFTLSVENGRTDSSIEGSETIPPDPRDTRKDKSSEPIGVFS